MKDYAALSDYIDAQPIPRLPTVFMLAAMPVVRFFRTARNIHRFVLDVFDFLTSGGRFSFWDMHPVLSDYDDNAGAIRTHYFWQDLWAAKQIKLRKVKMHYDVGSRLDGFIAHVLSFTPVTMIDIRPLPTEVDGLKFIQADATTLEGIESDSIYSLSSLHAGEHFGLGRYGDPIAPDADKAFMRSLARVLKPHVGARLYYSVPIGRPRVCFNAHRIYDPMFIKGFFEQCGLTMVSFSAVDDDGNFHQHSDTIRLEYFRNQRYACGMFEFTKV